MKLPQMPQVMLSSEGSAQTLLDENFKGDPQALLAGGIQEGLELTEVSFV